MQSLLDASTTSSEIYDIPQQIRHVGNPIQVQGYGQKYSSTAATTDKQNPDIIEGKIQSFSSSAFSTDDKKTCGHTDQVCPAAVVAVCTIIRSVLCSLPPSLTELIIRIRPFFNQFQAEHGRAPNAPELLTYIEETAPEALSTKNLENGKEKQSCAMERKNTSKEQVDHAEHRDDPVENKEERRLSLIEEPRSTSEERTPPAVEQAEAEDSKELPEVQNISLRQEGSLQTLMLKAVRRENVYLKNSLTCVQCRERPVEVTLLPCGHFVLCAVCSEPCVECPVCHARALAEVKTYLG